MIDVCTKSLEIHKELAAFVQWKGADGLKESEARQSTKGDKLLYEYYRREGNGKYAERNALISLGTTCMIIPSGGGQENRVRAASNIQHSEHQGFLRTDANAPFSTCEVSKVSQEMCKCLVSTGLAM